MAGPTAQFLKADMLRRLFVEEGRLYERCSPAQIIMLRNQRGPQLFDTVFGHDVPAQSSEGRSEFFRFLDVRGFGRGLLTRRLSIRIMPKINCFRSLLGVGESPRSGNFHAFPRLTPRSSVKGTRNIFTGDFLGMTRVFNGTKNCGKYELNPVN